MSRPNLRIVAMVFQLISFPYFDCCFKLSRCNITFFHYSSAYDHQHGHFHDHNHDCENHNYSSLIHILSCLFDLDAFGLRCRRTKCTTIQQHHTANCDQSTFPLARFHTSNNHTSNSSYENKAKNSWRSKSDNNNNRRRRLAV